MLGISIDFFINGSRTLISYYNYMYKNNNYYSNGIEKIKNDIKIIKNLVTEVKRVFNSFEDILLTYK